MFRAVFFDLDNTLIDFMRMKSQSCEAAILAMVDAGLEIDKKRAKDELYSLFQQYGMEDPLIFQRLIERLTGEINYRVLASAINAYRKTQIGLVIPYPGTRRTLVGLKERGLKLGVVSDAPKLKAWLRLTEMNIAEFFDFVIALEDTGVTKPNKKPFEMALKISEIEADKILFVGDNPERDIKGAKSAGMKTALAKYGQYVKSKHIKADYELKRIIDILKIIDENISD
ncbi:MAG: TIGR02253 family HAD-type hydrolase [Candidatus Diapherotrites archaeon]|nr:TIGR02253 family HAD-type hydrolase [Candidatus Diapherotrites archaeon]